MPRGPNSLARHCPRARDADLPVAKEAKFAEPLMEAVAPVMRREGGHLEISTEARRRGSACCAKKKRPRLKRISISLGYQ